MLARNSSYDRYPMLYQSLCALLLSAVLPAASATDFFAVRNDSQLARAVPLPELAPRAPEAGQLDFGASLDLISEFSDLEAPGERFRADGEILKLALSTSGRFSERSFWSVRLPLLHQGGGFMDRIIVDWHDFFGLPQGGRDQAPNDQYRFYYERDGEVLLDVQDGGNRLGDLEIAWHFEPADDWLLGVQLRAPTGDGDKLSGGGAWGTALWITRELRAGPVSGFVSAGSAFNERGDLLPEQQRRVTPFGGAGLGLDIASWLTGLVQVYAHRAPYTQTGIEGLGRDSVQLSVGGIFRLGQSTRLHLLFQEDLGVHASPDFSMQAALYW